MGRLGTMDRNGNLIPLDGDPSTDENGNVTTNETAVLDWKTIGTNGGRKVTMNDPAPHSQLSIKLAALSGARSDRSY